MYNNNQYFNPYMGQPYGYASPMQPQAKMVQLLKPEEIAELQKQGKTNELSIDNIELLEAYCTHRKDGKSVLEEIEPGKFYCPICKQTFNMMEALNKSQLEEIVGTVLDLIQTIKTMYVDVSDNVGRQFYQIIPLVKRLIPLYRLASEDLKRYGDIGMINPSNMPNGSFAMLGTLVGGPQYGYGYNYANGTNPYPGYGMQQPPMYNNMGTQQQPTGYPQQAPYGNPYPGQPMYQPQQNMAPQGQAPMGYQQPPVGYNPAPGYQQQPQQGGNPLVMGGAPAQAPAPQPQQAAPQQNAPAPQQGGVVTKNASFGI